MQVSIQREMAEPASTTPTPVATSSQKPKRGVRFADDEPTASEIESKELPAPASPPVPSAVAFDPVAPGEGKRSSLLLKRAMTARTLRRMDSFFVDRTDAFLRLKFESRKVRAASMQAF